MKILSRSSSPMTTPGPIRNARRKIAEIRRKIAELAARHKIAAGRSRPSEALLLQAQKVPISSGVSLSQISASRASSLMIPLVRSRRRAPSER